MKWNWVFILVFSFHVAQAQSSTELIASDMDASVVSLISAGPGALSTNPALAASVKSGLFGLYADNRFGLMELNLIRISGVIPVLSGQSIAVHASRMGISEYQETGVDFSYARKLSEMTAIGVSFGGEWYSKSKYERDLAIRSGLGLLIRWNRNSSFGFVIQNPWQTYFGRKYHEKSGLAFMLGYGYKPSDQIQLRADFKKEISNDWIMIFGASLSASSVLQWQYHFRSGSNTHQLGVVIQRKKLSTRICFSYHNLLGLSGGSGIFNNIQQDDLSMKRN